MARRPDFDVFYQALPIAGVDGTIASRMRGTAAAGNVHAKTGSIANVRSLSGYVTTADGERLVFVMLANHFTVPRRVVEVVQDRVLERLATFSRRGAARR
jgi:D-alanyl-D-alanine carboxypeptidase/D-alanyl-D-alanine-endopeptidase (penicillin-binding protein 4)